MYIIAIIAAGMAKVQAQAQEMSENRPETAGVTGVTESNPNITSKTIESNGINKEELNKVAQQNNNPNNNSIPATATPAHDNTPSL